uniref:Uncharacterized protein n=1 Tax=Parastrongyloides trichosuri TaxID=131310 RepID=A0A0N4Z524_PARTI
MFFDKRNTSRIFIMLLFFNIVVESFVPFSFDYEDLSEEYYKNAEKIKNDNSSIINEFEEGTEQGNISICDLPKNACDTLANNRMKERATTIILIFVFFFLFIAVGASILFVCFIIRTVMKAGKLEFAGARATHSDFPAFEREL